MKRLEIEVPDDIHALLLHVAREHSVTARSLGGAVVTHRLAPLVYLHHKLGPFTNMSVLRSLDSILLREELPTARGRTTRDAR